MPDPLKSFPYIVADGANQPASAAWDREFADSPVEGSGFEDSCRRQAQRCARSERSERTRQTEVLRQSLQPGHQEFEPMRQQSQRRHSLRPRRAELALMQVAMI